MVLSYHDCKVTKADDDIDEATHNYATWISVKPDTVTIVRATPPPSRFGQHRAADP